MKLDDEWLGSIGPHTAGGLQDMILFGKCLERQDADGNWHHVPLELWNPSYVPTTPEQKP